LRSAPLPAGRSLPSGLAQANRGARDKAGERGASAQEIQHGGRADNGVREQGQTAEQPADDAEEASEELNFRFALRRPPGA